MRSSRKQHACGCTFDEVKRPDGNVDCYLVDAVCEYHKEEQNVIYLNGQRLHRSVLEEVA